MSPVDRQRLLLVATGLAAGLLYGALMQVGALGWAMAAPCFALALALPQRTRGTSMVPTLRPNHVGLLLPTWWRRDRGALVVVRGPTGAPWVKRLAGLPHDVVISAAPGVTVNDRPVPHSRLPCDTTRLDPTLGLRWHLGPTEVFVLGDHVSSVDCRHHGPLPESALLAVFVPLFGWGEAETPTLPPEEAELVAHLRAHDPPSRRAVDAILAVPGWTWPALTVALRWALLELGDREREEALLARALVRDPLPEGRVSWATLLALVQASQSRPADALATLERVGRVPGSPDWPEWLTLRANLLARLGRWEEALAAAGEARAPGPEDAGFQGAELAALIGLARYDEALARFEALGRDDAWGAPCWEPYYRGVLATAQGELKEGGDRIAIAVRSGFPDLPLLRIAPLLEPLRRSESWAVVEAAIAQVEADAAG